MSGTKEIRSKMSSIRNIQKIAKAMELISASKMYKARKRVLSCEPYAVTIKKVIDHVVSGTLEYKHPYCIERKDVKSVGYWIVSSDRGLTGGLNTNLFKVILNDINKWTQLGVMVKLSIIGSKAISFFQTVDKNMIVNCISRLGDNPKISRLIGSVKVMLQLYNNNELDRLYLGYNKFVNTLSQIPVILQILPIIPKLHGNKVRKYSWDYIYEPESKMLLDILLQRYIEVQVYQGVVENLLSEQSARMIAMKNASDNGEVLIKYLKLFYNKVRQSKITQELAEIVSGSSVI